MGCGSFPQDHFSQLHEFSQNNGDLSNVLVPYVGRDWVDGPRVMICGKSPYGWDEEGDTLAAQCGNARDFINDCVVPGHYWSHFWTYAWEVIFECLRGTPYEPTDKQQRKQLARHLYWTNLAKVGGANQNLPPDLLDANSCLFTSTLIDEITRMTPSTVVFTTGSYGSGLIDSIVREVAASAVCWKKEDPNFWHFKPKGSLPLLIWQRHPQGWGREARQWAARRVADLSSG